MTRRTGVVLIAIFAVALTAASARAQSQSTWFLAEGANNGTFAEEILVGNPSASTLTVTVTLLPQPGAIAPATVKQFTLGPTSRLTVRLGADFNLNGASSARVSAVLAGTSTPADIVVERTMYFPNGTMAGAHNAGGVTSLAPAWTLAEGATTAFDTYILVVNPNPTPTDVVVTFLTTNGEEYQLARQINAQSRDTFWPKVEVAGLQSAEFSTFVESKTPGNDIVAERAMYFDGFLSGHDALGVAEPSTTWLFAEGYTAASSTNAFATFLLLANTGTTDAVATVDYLLDTGEVVTKDYPVDARRRVTIWVDNEGRVFDPRLRAASFGIRIRSTEPIVAERAMYWGTPLADDPSELNVARARDGHDTAGATAPSAKWAFAEGAQGTINAVPHDSYFLVANPNDVPISIRTTFVREDGKGIVREKCVGANSRTNVTPGSYPELIGFRFAAFLESVESADCSAAGGEGFVAERAMYIGSQWESGHANVGTPWTGIIATPPVATVPPVVTPPVEPPPVAGLSLTSVSPSTGRLGGGQRITLTGTGFKSGARVFFSSPDWTSDRNDNRSLPAVDECRSVAVNSATSITCTTPPRNFYSGYQSAGPVTVRVENGDGTTATLARGYTFRFNVLAFGDEIISGVPDRLKAALGSNGQFGGYVAVTNGGANGECAAGCGGSAGYQRFASMADAVSGSVDGYDAVVILEGVYDVRTGGGSGAARNGLRNILTAARDRGIVVVLTRLTSGTNLISSSALTDLGNQIWGLSEESLGMEVYRQSLDGIASGGAYPTSGGYDTMADLIRQKVNREFPWRPCDGRTDKPGHGCPLNP